MDEKTLSWAKEQLKQLRKPAMTNRQHAEEQKEEHHEPSTKKKTYSDAEG